MVSLTKVNSNNFGGFSYPTINISSQQHDISSSPSVHINLNGTTINSSNTATNSTYINLSNSSRSSVSQQQTSTGNSQPQPSSSTTTISSSSGGVGDERSATSTVSLRASSSGDIKKDIYLRNLCPGDINELKTLCTEWFPVELVHFSFHIFFKRINIYYCCF